VKKEISGIRQSQEDSLSEYWECFNKLCATYPIRQISELLLLHYFYKGITAVDWNRLDAASGGVFMDKNIVVNNQQFSSRGSNN